MEYRSVRCRVSFRDAYEIFFFKQKTAYEIGTGDWSSDVCSSDLSGGAAAARIGKYKKRRRCHNEKWAV